MWGSGHGAGGARFTLTWSSSAACSPFAPGPPAGSGPASDPTPAGRARAGASPSVWSRSSAAWCPGARHVELGCGRLHRLCPVAQRLLVGRELLGHFGPRLPGQDVLALDVQLVLLGQKHLLLHNLLRLCNEPLLEGLDLGEHLVRARLLGQRFDLGPVLEQLIVQRVHLLPQRLKVGAARVLDVQLPAHLVELQPQQSRVLEALPVGHLAVGERALLDLDLLVQQRQLVVAPDQLRAQDVSLVDGDVVFGRLPEALAVGLVDDVVEFVQLRLATGRRRRDETAATAEQGGGNGAGAVRPSSNASRHPLPASIHRATCHRAGLHSRA
eukprot:scaffold33140_cov101-Isochrysis_galbana.AAC.2